MGAFYLNFILRPWAIKKKVNGDRNCLHLQMSSVVLQTLCDTFTL